jgi:tetratricopeptide (TPR) repeat protein
MPFRCAASYGVVLALGAVTSLAQAEPAPATDKEASREQFRLGAQAYSEGRFKDAIDLFLEADRLSSNPVFAYNIGQSYEELGDAANALRWYRTYLRDRPGAPDQAEVEPRIRAAERHLQDGGVQQVSVLSSPEGAAVAIDGRRVGVAPWTVELKPGTHQLAVDLPGYAAGSSTFDLPAEHAIDVVIPLERLPDSTTVAVAKPSAENACGAEKRPGFAARIRPVTWATLGVGVAGLGAALGLELARSAAVSAARSSPTNLVGKEEYDRATSLGTASRVAVSIGGAVTALAAVLVYVDLSSGGPSGERVGAALGCPGGACGVGLDGAF